MENYELEHHGILGQKWGVRRFQNEDGSRTAAGMKRYGYKMQKKLDRAIDRADRIAKSNTKGAEQSARDLEDVRKNRGKSEYVQNQYDDIDDEELKDLIAQSGGWNKRAEDMARAQYKSGLFGSSYDTEEEYVKAQRDRFARNTLADVAIRDLEHDYRSQVETAEYYTKRYNALKTITIDPDLTRQGAKEVKRLIKRAGRD